MQLRGSGSAGQRRPVSARRPTVKVVAVSSFGTGGTPYQPPPPRPFTPPLPFQFQTQNDTMYFRGGRAAPPPPIVTLPPLPIPGLDGRPAPGNSHLRTETGYKAAGKTVVITGGSQGVGRATALVFAKKGYNVVVAARDPTRCQYVANDCAQVAGRQGASMAFPCDVTSERDVRDLANTVMSKYENVDVIVNCAGLMSRGAFMDTPAAEARRLMEVNYMGPFLMAQAFVPILLKEAERKKGLDRPSLIMVNSFAGKVPVAYMAAFTASKFALAGFTESIRSELMTQGVHVGQVHPGLVKSNHMERTTFFGPAAADDRKNFRNTVRAMGPMAQNPQDVADSIYNASVTKTDEVTVGIPFAAAAAGFRLTGINPAAIPFVHI